MIAVTDWTSACRWDRSYNTNIPDLQVTGETAITHSDEEHAALTRMKREALAALNHELRTPLTVIRGAIGLLAGGVAGELPERARQLVDVARQSSEQLASLLDDALVVGSIAESSPTRRDEMVAPTLQRILYVEDEAALRGVGQLTLEAVGKFKVEACSSGAEAVAKGPAFKPDLILLDVMMPGMDGPATLAALRKLPELAAIPVVFLTAKVQPDEVAAFKSLGAAAVLAKPFDPMKLPSILRNVWSEHRG